MQTRVTRLTPLFADYSASHVSRGNQACHAIGIPLIVLAILGLLPAPFAVALLAITAAWYAWMDWRLGAPFALVLAGIFFTAHAIPRSALAVAFVLGWAFQLVGHSRFERKSPSFMRNARHILVGPIWIFAKALDAAPARPSGTDRAERLPPRG